MHGHGTFLRGWGLYLLPSLGDSDLPMGLSTVCYTANVVQVQICIVYAYCHNQLTNHLWLCSNNADLHIKLLFTCC